MSISRAFAFLLMGLLFCGCTKKVQHQVASYRPGGTIQVEPVPRTALYSIRFLDAEGRKFGGVPGSHRLLQAGQRAGFATDDAGTVYAMAAEDRFVIEVPPGCGMVWSATYRKPTQFTKEVAKVAAGTGKVIAVGAGYVAGGFVKGMLDDDDDCDEEFQYARAQQRQKVLNHP